jgi:anaerobic selenocysteine-containing dehydrogenase
MPQAALSGAQWMPIRPGADAAFLLGMINYGLQKGLANLDWLRTYSNGPYLLRTDKMVPITQADLAEGGDKTLYAAIDAASKEPRFLGLKDGKYVGDTAGLELAFKGEVKLANGETVPAASAFEILRETAEPYTAEKVREIAGIPAADFTELAADFYRKKGVVDDGWYSSKNGNDSNNYALICILNLMHGTFDKKGGFIVTQGGGFGGVKVGTKGTKGSGPHGEKWEIKDGKRLDTVKFPEGAGTISAIYDAIEKGQPYPVRGLFITGSTMFHREAHTPSLIKALKSVELLVVQDIFPHEVVDYADYLLPCTYFLETREYTGVKWARDGYVQINDGPLTPPKGNDAREEVWQMCEILRRAYPDRAKERLGYDHEIKTREEFRKWYDGMFNKAWDKYIAKKNEAKPGDGDRIAREVKEQGYSLAAVKKYEGMPYKKPFDTPTGKAELVSFRIAEKYPGKGLSPVHKYEPAKAWTAPKPNSDEFYLVSGKDASGSSGVTIFTKPAQFVGDRTLWMNTADAARLGIRNADMVELTSLDSKEKGRVRVKVTNRVMQGTLFYHGFQGDVRTKTLANAPGYEWIREGINTNRLCPEYKEPLTGASTNNCTVRVVRI